MSPRIIALSGFARSGKDTIAELIREELRGLSVVKQAFADPMKDFCRQLFGFSQEQLYGDEREKPDPRWNRPDGSALTARYALQTLGTEWGRACDPDIWTKAGIYRAQRESVDVVVISDCRFVNESKAVHAAGGQVWRIKRGECAYTHQSEIEIWSPDMLVDAEIDNTGSLEATRAQVKRLLSSTRALSSGNLSSLVSTTVPKPKSTNPKRR